MESASHVSRYSSLLGLFLRKNGKSTPCVRTLGFIGSVHEKKWKVHPCVRAFGFIESVNKKQMKVQAMCQSTRLN